MNESQRKKYNLQKRVKYTNERNRQRAINKLGGTAKNAIVKSIREGQSVEKIAFYFKIPMSVAQQLKSELENNLA